ncbi:MAG TPA: ABC transporter permease [Thermotogota bacterium]|nr:ABC transporter permease [Thermotogota bacterium]HRW92999.1 ABC transporter permease [Thermotogota bacterium]
MKKGQLFELYRTGIAIGIALLLGYLIVFFTSFPEGALSLGEKIAQAFSATNEAFKYFLLGPVIKWRGDAALFNDRGFIQWINETVPIMITGLAVAIVFSAKIFNIGAEGQLFIGAVGATFAAVHFPAIPVLHPILVIAVAMLCGAGWAVIPGVIKSRLKASELVTSLMMNYVAFFFGLFLIKTFIRDQTAGSLVSEKFQDTALLPLLNERYKWHIGILIAIGLTIFVWFLMKRTTWGYRVRLVGDNIHFAHFSGIKTPSVVFQAQVVSGAIAGMAGIIELMGYHGRFLWLVSPGYGWDGIIIATLARNNPLYVPIAALFLSYIRVGAKTMGRYTDIAPEIVAILQAAIILLVTAEAFLAKWKQRAIEKEATRGEMTLEGGEKA